MSHLTEITPSQRNFCITWNKLSKKNGFCPSLHEIGIELGFNSPSSAAGQYMSRLVKKGIFTKDTSKSRATKLTDLGYSLIGEKSASELEKQLIIHQKSTPSDLALLSSYITLSEKNKSLVKTLIDELLTLQN